VKECLEKGTELVQAIANKLFDLPSTEDVDGPLVKLPPPTTRLPGEKPVSSSLLFIYLYLLNLPDVCTFYIGSAYLHVIIAILCILRLH
jgi:hypothetical protein